MTRLVDAAMAAYLGDLQPAKSWLTVVGRTITQETADQITWAGTAVIPTGAISTGSDPITTLVMLLFATAGLGWPLQPDISDLFAECNQRWRAATREAL